MLTISLRGMKKIHQQGLDLTPPVREVGMRARKRRVQEAKRRILVIDYQTWLSLTDHLITGLPSESVKER